MSNTLLFYLLGLLFTLVYGLSWLTRENEGGDIFGYHNVGAAMAPFATIVGVLMMLVSVLLWIFNTDPP